MKYLALVIFLIASSSHAFDRLSVATAAGTREQQLSLDYSRFWKIGGTRLYLGAGLRGTSQWSSGQNFQTAPALLTKGQEGPQTIFLSDKKKNIDDLRLNSAQVTSINTVFQIFYDWTDTWGIGTNIDVFGGSFGKKQKARYNPKSDDASFPETASARPTPVNLLLISENDRGSLNSEFYVRRNLGNNWGLKLAANFAFTEFTTTRRLRKDNDRFRHKSLLPSIGLTRDF